MKRWLCQRWNCCVMPAVHWIIQENNRLPGTVAALAEAIYADGQMAHLVTLKPGAGVPTLAGLPDSAAVVCQGPGFVTRALADPHYRTGLYFNPETFRWSAFRAGWPGLMLAQDGQTSTIPELLLRLEGGKKLFVRPDADSKAFDGAVYDAEQLRSVTKNWVGKTSQQIVVSEPLKIDAEWRLFVVDGEIVACSKYREGNRATIDGSVPHAAIEFGFKAAAIWSPASIYCLDLGISDGRIGVVEANCFNASRFYGADIDAIVRSVGRFAEKRSMKARS